MYIGMEEIGEGEGDMCIHMYVHVHKHYFNDSKNFSAHREALFVCLLLVHWIKHLTGYYNAWIQ